MVLAHQDSELSLLTRVGTQTLNLNAKLDVRQFNHIQTVRNTVNRCILTSMRLYLTNFDRFDREF